MLVGVHLYEAPVNLSFLSKAMVLWHFINCGRWYITTLPTVRLHYPSAFFPLFLFPTPHSHFSSVALRLPSFFSLLVLLSHPPTPSFLFQYIPSRSYLYVSTTVITLKRIGGSKGERKEQKGKKISMSATFCEKETQGEREEMSKEKQGIESDRGKEHCWEGGR